MLHGKFIQLNIQGKNGQHYLTGMYFITKVTDSISLINDRIVDIVVTFIVNIISKLKKKNEEKEDF